MDSKGLLNKADIWDGVVYIWTFIIRYIIKLVKMRRNPRFQKQSQTIYSILRDTKKLQKQINEAIITGSVKSSRRSLSPIRFSVAKDGVKRRRIVANKQRRHDLSVDTIVSPNIYNSEEADSPERLFSLRSNIVHEYLNIGLSLKKVL